MPDKITDPTNASILETSRRGFFQATAGAALGAAALGRRAFAESTPRRILAFIGTYSNPQGPEKMPGRGQGIYVMDMNPSTGALTPRQTMPNDSNPAWVALAPGGDHLYSANETTEFEGANSGSVGAYAVDHTAGHLRFLNAVPSEGAGPAHLSIHPSGKFVLVANYAGGTIAVIPLQADGKVSRATQIVHDQGTVGAQHAHSAPPGSFAISGHEQPHAHMIQSDPSGRFVFVNDLGLDRIFIYRFDAGTGTLTPNDPATVAVPPGDGPRHFAFHPSGRWFYSLQEEASTVMAFDYDSTRGTITAKQTLSSLPPGFAGTDYSSEILISADGKFLYAANRLHDSIAWFRIGATGMLTYGGEEWTRGDYPRSFNIDPTGNFLYSCNQRADAVTTFRVSRQTGALTFTGYYTPIGTPACIVFLPVA